MKRTAILLTAFSLLMIGCKEIKKENTAGSETFTEAVDHENTSKMSHGPDDTWVNDIVLNNGIKWQANKETTDGIMAMLTLIDKNKAPNVADYKLLGDDLNEVKNTVVKKCTMKGASHDNLHVWLYPLIEKIEQLQNVKKVEEGAQLTSKIKTHLEGYYDYFI